jgi:hypothetical protein
MVGNVSSAVYGSRYKKKQPRNLFGRTGNTPSRHTHGAPTWSAAHGAPTFKSAWQWCGVAALLSKKKEWRLRRISTEPT